MIAHDLPEDSIEEMQKKITCLSAEQIEFQSFIQTNQNTITRLIKKIREVHYKDLSTKIKPPVSH